MFVDVAAITAMAAEAAAVVGEVGSAIGAGMTAALPEALGGASGAIGAGTTVGAGTAAGAGAAAAAGAGGISAGAGGIAGSIGAGIVGAGEGAALGAGLGAGTSALTGGDIGKGAAMGAATGAIGGGLSSAASEFGSGASAVSDVGNAGKNISAPVEAVPTNVTSDISGAAHAPTDFNIPTSKYINVPPTETIPTAGIKAPVAESSSIIPKIITDNPKASLAAAGLGGAYLMSQKKQGLMANEAPTASIYDPTPYTQADIPRTTVPKYYADGGIVPPQAQQPTQPQQPAQPMNKFVQMGMDNAQQRIQQVQAQQTQAQQPQQPQQAQQAQQAPQAGIPVTPTQMQPQQQFADGGLTEGTAGSGLLKSVYGAGIGKSVAPGVGNTLFGDGKHDNFMQQVQQTSQQQMGQQLATQRAPGSQTAQTVAPVQPVAPVAVQRAAAGGIMKDNLGGYSHGGIAGLTRGPGDGVSDSIPAQIGESGKQPARLADGEFVIPARIVSELGNGSTEAGAKALQAMVDRVQARRSKTIGKGKVAVNSKANKVLPA